GFVNAPAGSMAGIQALQQQLMPQPGREGSCSSTGLQGSANIPWAITKDEKTYVQFNVTFLMIVFTMAFSKPGMVWARDILGAILRSKYSVKAVCHGQILNEF